MIVTQSLTGVLSLEAVTKRIWMFSLKQTYLVQTGPREPRKNESGLVCTMLVLYTVISLRRKKCHIFLKTEVNVPVQHLKIKVRSGQRFFLLSRLE